MNWWKKTDQEQAESIAAIMEKHMTELRAELRTSAPGKMEERVAELEVKMAKLWNALLEVKPGTGKEGLTKLGRRFGGKTGIMNSTR